MNELFDGVNMNFKLWLESKFINIPPETQSGLEDVIRQLSNGEMQDGQIGQIPFTDHKGQNRPIAVIGNSKLSSIGYYDPNRHTISINTKSAVRFKSQELFNILSHELTHAIDPKYHPTMPDAWFDKGIARGQFDSTKAIYEKTPTEFDAFGGGMANTIRQQYNTLSPQQKPQFIADIENWLKGSGQVPFSVSHNNQNIWAIEAWKTKPTLWKKFQQRMYQLVQELKNQ